MDAYTFLNDYLTPNRGLYIFTLIISLVVYSMLCLKYTRCIIDPLFMQIINISLASSVPIFMYFVGCISSEMFMYFISSQFIFWTCFILTIKPMAANPVKNYPFGGFDKFFLLISFVIMVCTTLISYKINGIPLFNENRFEKTVEDSAGIIGLLRRLSGMFSAFINISIVHFIVSKRFRFALFIGIPTLIIAFLDGSKGFILSIVYSYFYYATFYQQKKIKIRMRYIILIVLSPLLTILITSDSLYDAFSFLIFRFIANGDMYWNSYPDGVIDQVHFDYPLLNLTYMFWGPFRNIFPIYVPDTIMTTGGTEVFTIASGFIPTGGAPNSPFISFMSWIYYKWGGLFMVALQGCVVSRLIFPRKIKRMTLPNITVRSILYGGALTMMKDVYLFFYLLFNLMIFYAFYIICKNIYYYTLKSKRNGNYCHSGLQ